MYISLDTLEVHYVLVRMCTRLEAFFSVKNHRLRAEAKMKNIFPNAISATIAVLRR